MRLHGCLAPGLMRVFAIPSKMRTSEDDHFSTKDTAVIRTASTWPLLQHHGPVFHTAGKTATVCSRQDCPYLPLDIPVEQLWAPTYQSALPAWDLPHKPGSHQTATEGPPVEPPLLIALSHCAGSWRISAHSVNERLRTRPRQYESGAIEFHADHTG